jgi:hypothetical protein
LVEYEGGGSGAVIPYICIIKALFMATCSTHPVSFLGACTPVQQIFSDKITNSILCNCCVTISYGNPTLFQSPYELVYLVALQNCPEEFDALYKTIKPCMIPIDYLLKPIIKYPDFLAKSRGDYSPNVERIDEAVLGLALPFLQEIVFHNDTNTVQWKIKKLHVQRMKYCVFEADVYYDGGPAKFVW